METVIPVGKFIPYTLDDLSVVIPQASQYIKRMKWFMPQYIKGTPPEVVKNTIVIYDPEDRETKLVVEQYRMKGATVTPPHSTYKMQEGFKYVKTRLCVRMHNDTYIARTDWAQSLIDQFNNDKNPQLIGAFNWSGGMAKTRVDAVLENYPIFKEIYDKLEFSNESIGSTFMSAYCMASQTYVMQSIYNDVVRINQGGMNQEDCLFTLLTSLNNIKLIGWSNMFDFVRVVSQAYGDFENEVLPTEPKVLLDSDPKAVFKEAVYG